MTRTVAIACGGTGGHFYPTLAIAEELERKGTDVVLFIAGHHAEEQLRLAADRGFSAREVPACRLRRRLGSLVAFPFRLLRGILVAGQSLKAIQPDLVLGMGSFAAVPTCLAAVKARTPLVLHEGNAWMGRANRSLSRWARVAGISLPLEPSCVVRCPTVHVGMPLRQALLDAAGASRSQSELRQHYALDPATPTLLAFGGSQGARFLNTLVANVTAALGDEAASMQVIHFTGTEDNAELHQAYDRAGMRACVRRADPDIQHAYGAADLVLCRAGASSCCELALFGKPAILVPLPTAAEDHQSANARLFAEAGAAVHLAQQAATVETLAEHLHAWLADPADVGQMGEAMRRFAKPHAAEEMADLCMQRAQPERP